MPDARAAAFERVFRAQQGPLIAFCFRRVDDRELAQDLAADTFRIAWSRWDEPRRSDRAWLFGVARNLIGNEYRRRRTAKSVALEDGDDLPDARASQRFDAVEVQVALSSLSLTDQEVLQLTYWDRLSATETAELLGITPTAVWVRISRARRAFARAWQSQLPVSITVETRIDRP